MLPWYSFMVFCLPHARGGVSQEKFQQALGALSSPRTWGCFWCLLAASMLMVVFPTHVGVFPQTERATDGLIRLPHARGGVSKTQDILATNLGASPHMWGSP